MIYFYIYLLGVIDALNTTLVWGAVLFVITSTFVSWALITAAANGEKFEDEASRGFLKWFKRWLCLTAVVVFASILTPSRQSLLLMGGYYVGKEVVSSDIGQAAQELLVLEIKNAVADAKKKSVVGKKDEK